jgi:hypothetical protein
MGKDRKDKSPTENRGLTDKQETARIVSTVQEVTGRCKDF